MIYLGTSLKKYSKLLWLIIIIIAMTYSLLGALVNLKYKQDTKVDKLEVEIGDKRELIIGESLSDTDYYSFKRDSESNNYYNSVNLQRDLLESEEVEFIIANTQPIYIYGDDVDKKFLFGYEDGGGCKPFIEDGEKSWFVKTVQVSDEFINHFPVKISEGRFFDESDYSYISGKKVPIILGSEYKEYFKIGDEIKADYLSEKMQLEIIGFLDEKSFFLSHSSNELESCSRYVVLPCFLDVEDGEFARSLVLQQFSGVLVSDKNYEEIIEIIDKIKEKNHLLGWDIGIYDTLQDNTIITINDIIKQYSVMTKEISKHFTILIILMMIGEVVVLCMVIGGIIIDQIKDYGILILNGASKGRIIFYAWRISAIVLGSGDIIAAYICFVNKVNYKILILMQVVPLTTLILILLFCAIYIRRINICEMIGGKE